jgi:hypothetical protein
MVVKTKLRTCNICGIKKKVAEFSSGKICNICERTSTESVSTLREESTDDEISVSTKDDRVYISTNGDTNDDLRSLHTKIDHLHQRFDKMEVLMMGLMELVGKINYDMEINKVRKDE